MSSDSPHRPQGVIIPEVSHPVRLSVILPSRSVRTGMLGPTAASPRGLAERAIQSVLRQPDPVGTEVLVAIDGEPDRDQGMSDYLKSVFFSELRSGRLSLVHLPRSGDPAYLRNRAVPRAKGSFLAFMDLSDRWRPERLNRLDPLLKKYDLILSTRQHPGHSSDWFRTFLFENWAVPGSTVIRRELFERVGGYPEGYSAAPLPRRVPGADEYEFWLKCLARLMEDHQRERFRLLEDHSIESEADEFDRMSQGAGAGDPMKMLASIQDRVSGFRELVSLARLTPKLPRRYWGDVIRRARLTGGRVFSRRSGRPREIGRES